MIIGAGHLPKTLMKKVMKVWPFFEVESQVKVTFKTLNYWNGRDRKTFLFMYFGLGLEEEWVFMAGQSTAIFGWSWPEVSVLGSQVFGQALMESCEIRWPMWITFWWKLENHPNVNKKFWPSKNLFETNVLVIAFRITLTLNVKLVGFGHQVAVCVNKRHNNAIFGGGQFLNLMFNA